MGDKFNLTSADPPPPTRKPGETKYPWPDMTEEGQYFDAGPYSHGLRSSILASGRRWFEKHNPKLTIQTQKTTDEETGEERLYVWAVKA